MKRTKIICTMGPAADRENVMRDLIRAGMDVARFNFSHGDYEEQKGRMDRLKALRDEEKRPIAILLDTKGPEIRTGVLADGKKVTLVEGQEFILTTEDIVGDSHRVSQTYDKLPEDLSVGNTVLIDDGLIQMTVTAIEGSEVICRVENGGELGERKGVNLPNVIINLPPITEKDRQDILFGIEQDIDFIAASFVRNAKAIEEIRALLKEHNAEHIDIIAKVENREGLDNIDEIIEAADGVMVARGDMGVEIPAEEVPYWQRTIIAKVNAAFKPCIVATQMLDSMIRNPRPTRAEVSDVADAIAEGTDVIMLSGETANGKYPVEALKTMVRIAEFTEKTMAENLPTFEDNLTENNRIAAAVGVAAVRTAMGLRAKCILTPTMSGKTPRLVCNLRPEVPIYAVTPDPRTSRKVMIDWGVTPIRGYEEDSTENIVTHAMYCVKKEKLVDPGDLVVVTAGDPATNIARAGHKKPATNMIHVMEAF